MNYYAILFNRNHKLNNFHEQHFSVSHNTKQKTQTFQHGRQSENESKKIRQRGEKKL